MRLIISLSILFMILYSVDSYALTKPQYTMKHLRQLFENFMQKYHKHYSGQKEIGDRLLVFKSNLQSIIKENNKPNKVHYLEIGPFTDMEPKEFISYQEANNPRKSDDNDLEKWRKSRIAEIEDPKIERAMRAFKHDKRRKQFPNHHTLRNSEMLGHKGSNRWFRRHQQTISKQELRAIQ